MFKYKRIIGVVMMFLIPFTLLAQYRATGGGFKGSSFYLTTNAGWSNIDFNFQNAQNLGSYALGTQLGYAYFMTKSFGLSLGASVQHYGVTAVLDGQISWENVMDSDGEVYEHIVDLRTWKELHDTWYAEFPLAMIFAIDLSRMWLTFELGMKYSMYLNAHYSASGQITHRGYYDKWHLMLYDIPEHGFYTTNSFLPKGKLKFDDSYTLFGKIGVAVPIAERCDFVANAYFTKGLSDVARNVITSENGKLGFRNDREGMQQIHYFMEDYSTLLHTEWAGEKASLFSVGVEIGVRFRIPQKRRYDCRCVY